MTTMFNTPRGLTYDPMVVELWPWNGAQASGRLELCERVEVTWAERGTGTVVLEAPLDEVSQQLLDIDSTVLLVVTFNGKRHVSTVVKAEAFAEDDSPEDIRIKVTTATPWSLLQGQIIPPDPDAPIAQQASAFYEITGPVETVVKDLVSKGTKRVGHPIFVKPDLGRGMIRTVKARNDTTAELVEDALTGTGYRLSLEAWLPGDKPVDGMEFSAPMIIADVVPYREQPGLVWSAVAQDLSKWSLSVTRPSMTRVIVGDDGDETAQVFTEALGDGDETPWGRREGYVEVKKDESLQDKGVLELEASAGDESIDVEASPSSSWEFGTDGGFARQYDVGDWVTVQLPGLGDIKQIITEVTVELTPVSLTVTPQVATPDTNTDDEDF